MNKLEEHLEKENTQIASIPKLEAGSWLVRTMGGRELAKVTEVHLHGLRVETTIAKGDGGFSSATMLMKKYVDGFIEVFNLQTLTTQRLTFSDFNNIYLDGTIRVLGSR
jgi:hypothetical protein